MLLGAPPSARTVCRTSFWGVSFFGGSLDSLDSCAEKCMTLAWLLLTGMKSIYASICFVAEGKFQFFRACSKLVSQAHRALHRTGRFLRRRLWCRCRGRGWSGRGLRGLATQFGNVEREPGGLQPLSDLGLSLLQP